MTKLATKYASHMCVNTFSSLQHVKQVAEFAMEAIEAAAQVNIDDDAPERGTVQIRVGFHSGPVVSNVIGSLNPR